MEIHNLTVEEFFKWLGIHHPTIATRVGQLLENTEELAKAVVEDGKAADVEEAFTQGQENYRTRMKTELHNLLEAMEVGNV